MLSVIIAEKADTLEEDSVARTEDWAITVCFKFSDAGTPALSDEEKKFWEDMVTTVGFSVTTESVGELVVVLCVKIELEPKVTSAIEPSDTLGPGV